MWVEGGSGDVIRVWWREGRLGEVGGLGWSDFGIGSWPFTVIRIALNREPQGKYEHWRPRLLKTLKENIE